jgi:hypothetical protein
LGVIFIQYGAPRDWSFENESGRFVRQPKGIIIQASLVNHHHVLTNEQLNEAVVITRSSPGANLCLWAANR